MASVTDRALLFADHLRSDVEDEAVKELTGESGHTWAVALIAFVLGAAAAVAIVIVLGRREVDEISSESGDVRADETPVEGNGSADALRHAWVWGPLAGRRLAPKFRPPARS